ncbi:hypothetical protein [Sorangium sp. So ce363]|uniref:hypothetical protein n=1 Tax=Sorangium sp. So ce363 TaxID=3133304 RepID=UPI003F63F6DD
METAKKTLTWAKERVDRIVRRLAGLRWIRRSRVLRGVRSLRDRVRREIAPPQRRPPEHADERTMRRTAERDAGGTSSAESAARYAGGVHVGGTHGGKAVPREGPEHQRPELEEPQARIERTSGGEDHIPEKRSGA